MTTKCYFQLIWSRLPHDLVAYRTRNILFQLGHHLLYLCDETQRQLLIVTHVADSIIMDQLPFVRCREGFKVLRPRVGLLLLQRFDGGHFCCSVSGVRADSLAGEAGAGMCCAKASLVTPTFQFFFGDAEIIKAVLCSDTCVLSSDVCVLSSEESTQKKKMKVF